ncbi:MAG: hypothetical protein RLZZ385_2008, partial [Pseudomonadota bacterium]
MQAFKRHIPVAVATALLGMATLPAQAQE